MLNLIIQFPFVDYGFISIDDNQSWHAGVAETYIKELSLELPRGYEYNPEGMYLCSHVNIGSAGNFDMSVIDRFRDTVREIHDEEVESKLVRGTIASRLKKDGELHLIMELQIKID